MRHHLAGLAAVWLVVLLAPGSASGEAAAPVLDAKAILDHVDDLFRGKSSRGTFTMKVVTQHYTREMTLEAWSKGEEYSLVRILLPEKEKNTATLKAENNIWNYLPKVNRVIKVPSSMMGGSWMGSHFTNDDLVKESRMATDFTYDISFHGERGGQNVIELTLVPNPDAAVVWGKIIAVVRDDNWLPVSVEYYDEDLVKTRTMTFSDVRPLGGRTIPAAMRMTPADKPQEYTEVVYQHLEFDVELSDGLFSLRSLQQQK